MPNPKGKFSRARRDKRRAANFFATIKTPTLVRCDNPACGEMHMPHRVCPSCGRYNGRQVLAVRREHAE